MERIVRLEVRPPYRLYVEFDDGVQGEYDMSRRLNGPVFEALRDPAFFASVRMDEYGVPVWPNGTDIAPDALHERLAARMVNEGTPSSPR
jgi:hypothetical protein